MAGAPDDYSAVFAAVGLAVLEANAMSLSRTLVADGAPAQASLVRQAVFALRAELKSIADDTAKKVEQAIIEEESASRVRPDSGGQGGSRLEDFVGRSDPLPAVPGSVGVNYEPALYDNVPWWWTNEEGYSGHLGREIFGIFQVPGSSRPNPAEFRHHAIFTPHNTRGGRGTISEPIPARRFVKAGIDQVEGDWHGDVRAAKAKFLATCRAAVAAAPPPQPKGARRRRGGRKRP